MTTTPRHLDDDPVAVTPPADQTRQVTLTSAVLGLAAAILGLLRAFGVDLTADQYAAILTLVGAAMLVAALLWSRYGIAKARVVEQTPDGRTVVAGPANEIPTGVVVRDNLGDLSTH